MRTLSWILLAVVALLVALASLGSAYISYFGDTSTDQISNTVTLADLEIDAETVKALQGRRGTAAAFGLGFAVLLIFLVLGPVRKGEAWAYWAVLVSTIVVSTTILIRVVSIGSLRGAETGVFLLLVSIPAVFLGLKAGSGKPSGGSQPDSSPPGD